MRKAIASAMGFLILLALAACGCDDGSDIDLVFVNDSDTVIMAVLVDFEDRAAVTQNADSSPLKRGESFGFEAGEYPVTVVVYDRLFEGAGQKKIGSITIGSAPQPGERWYVTARNGGMGLVLTADMNDPHLSTN